MLIIYLVCNRGRRPSFSMPLGRTPTGRIVDWKPPGKEAVHKSAGSDSPAQQGSKDTQKTEQIRSLGQAPHICLCQMDHAVACSMFHVTAVKILSAVMLSNVVLAPGSVQAAQLSLSQSSQCTRKLPEYCNVTCCEEASSLSLISCFSNTLEG